MKPIAMLLLLLCTNVAGADAPAEPPPATPTAEELTTLINGLDAKLFAAFNRCDLDTLGSLFAEDVEFYHDKGGLMVGRAAVVDAVRSNICGKVRREVVDGSLEVHPMQDIGALQLGVHRFCETGAEECGGVARFVHLWRPQDDGGWVITRVYSYDHQPLPPAAPASP